MNGLRHTIAASILVCTAHAAGAEGLSMINLADSASMYKALYANTPIEPEFMLVPKFAIVGSDNKFVFSTGASLKFTSCYDWGNPVRDPNGMGVSAIDKARDNESSLFQMSAGGSGIFFNIIGFPNTAKQIGLFISIGVDTDGDNSYKLGAGQVYMRYRDFQCGYVNSLYNDRAADAYTIDSHGPCASGAHNTVGFNWQHSFGSHVRVGAGVETPNVSYTQYVPDSNTGSAGIAPSPQNVPDFPMYAGYDWSGGHVRLSAVLRTIHTADNVNDTSAEHLGWGVKLTGNSEIGPLNLFLMAQTGRSIANYFKDDAGIGLDLVPDENNPYKLTATRSWGFISGARYRFSPQVFVTAQCSFMRNFIPHYGMSATTAFDRQMRRGFSSIANVIWKISPLLNVGMEYRHGCRTDCAHNSLHNNRVYAMLMMTF